MRVAKDKTLILITLILGSGILLRSTSSIHGVVAFSLEGRRDRSLMNFKSIKQLAVVSSKEFMSLYQAPNC